MHKKKLAFICARLPYPATSGRKNSLFNYCKILHNFLGYEITILSFLEKGDTLEGKPDFIDNVIKLPDIKAKQKIYNLIKYTFILKKFPMQVSLFYDPDIINFVNEKLKEIKPDLLLVDMVRTTEYGLEFNGYKIADLDDMLSLRYERQLNMGMRDVNPYGSYLYTLPIYVQKILSITLFKKAILKKEVKLLSKYEKNISKVYNNTIFVAEHEAELLNKEMNFNKAVAIPIGVDIDYYGEFYGKLEIKKNTIAFLGAMDVSHNEAGLIHFITNIFPIIKRNLSQVKLIVVGGGVTDKLRQISSEDIKFTGRIEDVRIEVGNCEVFICPLTFGSGIKTKNLEAMAMGVPVVTTEIGAENIDAENGVDWLIANDDMDFANKVIDILTNTELREKLAKNAHEYVKNNFTWKVAEERFKTLLEMEE